MFNSFCVRRIHSRTALPQPFRARLAAFLVVLLAASAACWGQGAFQAQLKDSSFKIAHECYVDNNWEIFVMNADGSDPVNLTHTADLDEHYPQVSPDGSKLCYSVDEGEGRDAVRSLWVMDIDGKHRRKLADHAREPFWRPDGKEIGFLPQEFPKFNVIDFYTKGMRFYDLSYRQNPRPCQQHESAPSV